MFFSPGWLDDWRNDGRSGVGPKTVLIIGSSDLESPLETLALPHLVDDEPNRDRKHGCDGDALGPRRRDLGELDRGHAQDLRRERLRTPLLNQLLRRFQRSKRACATPS